jgi:hypothetical protein
VKGPSALRRSVIYTPDGEQDAAMPGFIPVNITVSPQRYSRGGENIVTTPR